MENKINNKRRENYWWRVFEESIRLRFDKFFFNNYTSLICVNFLLPSFTVKLFTIDNLKLFVKKIKSNDILLIY